MKILELDLKKKVLIVDLPQKVQNFKEVTITNNVLFADGKGNRTCLFIKFRDKLDNESINEYLEKGFKRIVLDYIEGDYEFLCKGSELTEEIASELVEETIMYEKYKVKCYRYRSYKEGFVGFDNAIESFISAVESKEKFWLENPIDKRLGFLGNVSEIDKQTALQKQKRRWQEAEEKTFRSPLIFVKK